MENSKKKNNCTFINCLQVMHSIIGRQAKLGDWCRVEGSAICSDPNPNVAYAKMIPQLPLFNDLDGRLNPTITILG